MQFQFNQKNVGDKTCLLLHGLPVFFIQKLEGSGEAWGIFRIRSPEANSAPVLCDESATKDLLVLNAEAGRYASMFSYKACWRVLQSGPRLCWYVADNPQDRKKRISPSVAAELIGTGNLAATQEEIAWLEEQGFLHLDAGAEAKAL